LLVAPWIYAHTCGIANGRELERLCGCQDAYRWLCGGLTISYHTLNDFKSCHRSKLDRLFVEIVARLEAVQVNSRG